VCLFPIQTRSRCRRTAKRASPRLTPNATHQQRRQPLTHPHAERRSTRKPPLDRSRLRLLQAQHGQCPLCRGLLLHADYEPQTPQEWEQWVKVTRTAIRKHAIIADAGDGTSHEPVAQRLIHAHCARRHHIGTATRPAT